MRGLTSLMVVGMEGEPIHVCWSIHSNPWVGHDNKDCTWRVDRERKAALASWIRHDVCNRMGLDHDITHKQCGVASQPLTLVKERSMFSPILIQMIDGIVTTEVRNKACDAWTLGLWQVLLLHNHVRAMLVVTIISWVLVEWWVGRWGRDADRVSVPKPCRQRTHEYLSECHSPHQAATWQVSTPPSPEIWTRSSQSTQEDELLKPQV